MEIKHLVISFESKLIFLNGVCYMAFSTKGLTIVQLGAQTGGLLSISRILSFLWLDGVKIAEHFGSSVFNTLKYFFGQ